jgi:mRNA-decapping enzyme subunit 2
MEERKRWSSSEVLGDLASRFIINLPSEELESLERIGFHLEAAFW